MKLFSAAGPLPFFAISLLCPLKKTARENTFTLVVAHLLTNMTRCMPLLNTTAVTVIVAFLEYQVYAYGAPQYVPADSEKNFCQQVFRLSMRTTGLQALSHHRLSSTEKNGKPRGSITRLCRDSDTTRRTPKRTGTSASSPLHSLTLLKSSKQRERQFFICC